MMKATAHKLSLSILLLSLVAARASSPPIPADDGTGKLSDEDVKSINARLAALEQTVRRLDGRASPNDRLEALEAENKVLVTDRDKLSERLSDVEDKLSVLVTGFESEEEREKHLAELETQVNGTEIKPGDGLASLSWMTPGPAAEPDLPTVCEPGMSNGIFKNYPKYVIMKDDLIGRDFVCDTQTDGGGWIIFQRRAFGDEDFYRDWATYRDGFGNLTGDFWLGNEAVHKLTNEEDYELRIDIRRQGHELFASYAYFRLESEFSKYRLILGAFTGTGRDALSYHKDREFSTFDQDNDNNDGPCAVWLHGGYWYRSCYMSNLNGKWGEKANRGNIWDYDRKSYKPVSLSEMKIRRIKGRRV